MLRKQSDSWHTFQNEVEFFESSNSQVLMELLQSRLLNFVFAAEGEGH